MSDQIDRFRGRRFPEEIIMLCVRWYLRYCLSYRDLEEMMAERGVEVDHSTVARWVLHFGPILNDLIRREMRRPNVRGELMKRTFASRAAGPIYIERLTRPKTRLIFCCLRTEI